MTNQDNKILNAVSQAIFDKKGFNILVLDVRGISTMTDYYIIAEGSVDRHVKSLYSTIKDKMIELEVELYCAEGMADAVWIVMDYGEFVIHLLTPDMREKYALEELWKKAKIVDVEIDVSNEISYPPKK